MAEVESDWSRAATLWSALGCEYEAALALAGADDDELLRQSLVKLEAWSPSGGRDCCA